MISTGIELYFYLMSSILLLDHWASNGKVVPVSKIALIFSNRTNYRSVVQYCIQYIYIQDAYCLPYLD